MTRGCTALWFCGGRTGARREDRQSWQRASGVQHMAGQRLRVAAHGGDAGRVRAGGPRVTSAAFEREAVRSVQLAMLIKRAALHCARLTINRMMAAAVSSTAAR